MEDTMTETETRIEVELESAVGPRVMIWGDADHEEIEAELPVGWRVHDEDWNNGVRLDDGVGWSYGLSGPWYTVRDADGGTEHTFRADSEAEAGEIAKEWMAEGDYNLESTDETIWVHGHVSLLGAESGDRVTARIDPPEPKCKGDGHIWTGEHGVHGHGGGVIYWEECAHNCGWQRHVDTWAQDIYGRQGLRSERYVRVDATEERGEDE